MKKYIIGFIFFFVMCYNATAQKPTRLESQEWLKGKLLRYMDREYKHNDLTILFNSNKLVFSYTDRFNSEIGVILMEINIDEIKDIEAIEDMLAIRTYPNGVHMYGYTDVRLLYGKSVRRTDFNEYRDVGKIWVNKEFPSDMIDRMKKCLNDLKSGISEKY